MIHSFRIHPASKVAVAWSWPLTSSVKIKNEWSSALHINPSEADLSAQCTLLKTQDLNDHPLLHVFLASALSGCSVFLSITLHINCSQLSVPEG